jgi:protein phosphatase
LISATEIFSLNELGKRTNNEDCISPAPGTATLADTLFIVCDGVGGENKGEVASEIVCLSIREYLKKQNVGNGNERGAIQEAIQYANKKLAAYVATDESAKRMSTTLALVSLGEKSVLAAWCGDTRIHHIRNGKILWRSKDHSLVSELISQGELTEEEARSHPKRNVITRSLNALNYNSTVDFHEINNFNSGDYLLLCSDGFLEKINDKIIYEILVNGSGEDKAKSFLSFCDGITRDNFSMYLIRGEHSSKKTQRVGIPTIAIILTVVLLLVSLFLILA